MDKNLQKKLIYNWQKTLFINIKIVAGSLKIYVIKFNDENLMIEQLDNEVKK